jgi:nucleotide sugar dehydrogenase
MTICVIGLGKIGLPLAVHFANNGNEVIGIDINLETVELINRGREPFPGEKDLDKLLKATVTSKKFCATTDFSSGIKSADVILVIVPLFVNPDGSPDFSALDSVTEQIARHMKPETLVIYETTLPVGTTRTRFLPVLSGGSKLVEGIDFFLAFSPERVLTGRIFSDLRKYPKIVGGLSIQSTRRASEFYTENIKFDTRSDLGRKNGVWQMDSADEAEFVKLAETTYRDVNIGLANVFSKYSYLNNLDIHRVIEAANSQSYSHIHMPGISVGGHCIPIYPRFYLWNDPEANLVAVARQANDSMPMFFAQKLYKQIGQLSGKRILILGATYRPGVKELAFSGVYPLSEELTKLGAKVSVFDPMLTSEELSAFKLAGTDDLLDFEIAIIHTAHSEFNSEFFNKMPKLRYILDGRNHLRNISIHPSIMLI